MEPTLKPRRTKTPEQALASLMRLCARAEKSSGDARRLMRNWQIGAEDSRRILERLIKERFIDDERYAAAFVREKSNLGGWGGYKIRTALKRKEIEDSIIERALASINPDQSREQLRNRLARKERTTKASTLYEKRTKLIRYGLSLGYEFDIVSDTVTELMKAQNEACDTPLY